MKKLIIILTAILVSVNVYSQSELELAVLKELNTFRKSNGKAVCVMDSAFYKVATYQSEYYIKIVDQKVCKQDDPEENYHDEKYDAFDFEELTFEQRSEQFVKGKMFFEISMPVLYAQKEQRIKQIAKQIINDFATSKKRNEIMLSDVSSVKTLVNVVGISVIEYSKASNYNTPVYAVNIVFGLRIVKQK